MQNSVFYYLDFIINEVKEEIEDTPSFIIYTSKTKKERKDRYTILSSKQHLYPLKENTSILVKKTEIKDHKTIQNKNKSLSNELSLHKSPYSSDTRVQTKFKEELQCELYFENYYSENSKQNISKINEFTKINDINKTKIVEINIDNINNDNNFQNPIYICNFYECCCECCCEWWFQNILKRISMIYFRIKKKTMIYLITNAKKNCFLFITIGMFYDTSLINVFSIMIGKCIFEKTQPYFYILLAIFTIIEIFASAFYFYANVFLISFISTRREFMKIDPSDKITRGRLLYYHINKAIIYAFFHFSFELLFKIIFLFKRPFYEVNEGSDTSIFWLLKYSFFLFFIIHRYSNWKDTTLIQEDCEILKFQNRYYTLQNVFLKFLPKPKILFKILKKTDSNLTKENSSINSINQIESNSPNFIEKTNEKDVVKNEEGFHEFRIEVDNILKKTKNEINNELNIIEKQKFKRILRNRGLLPVIPIILIYVLLGQCILYIGVCIFSLIDQNYEKLQLEKNYYISPFIIVFILNISEFTLIPILACFTLKRKYFFDFEGETVNSWMYEED